MPLRNARVLIVEDEPRLRDLLCDALPEMGYQAIAAPSAENALRQLRTTEVDIVLLDLNLPSMDGLTFLEQFRRDHSHTPVIILTGYGSLDAAKRAIRHGVLDFLTKPCHMGEIEAVLDRARRVCEAQQEQAVTTSADRADLVDGNSSDARRTLEAIENEAILAALRRHNGNRSAAAAELGISRRTLYNRCQRLDLSEFEM